MFWWLIILLSAALFNCSFFMPDLFGWGAIVAVVLLWLDLYKHAYQTRSEFVLQNFYRGLAWGVLVFFPQLYWILQVLTDYSKDSTWFCVGAYILLCSYFACTCALWWASMAFIGWFAQMTITRLLAYALTSVGYFVWLGRWGALVLVSGDGYPLLNPLIPLSAYRWFLSLVCLVSSFVIGPNYFYDNVPGLDQLVCLRPLENKKSKRLYGPSALGQLVYHQLCDVSMQNKHENVTIYCASESFFAYQLHQDMVDLWTAALPEKAIFIVGAQSMSGGQPHQSCFLIQSGRIKKIYVKKHLVPFVESIPAFWRLLGIKKTVLCAEHEVVFALSKNRHYNKIFWGERELCLRLVPQLCSEFIWAHKTSCFRKWVTCAKAPLILWLVNDSWFIPSFRKILNLAGCLRGAWIGLPVIFVGHEVDNGTTVKRLGF